MAQHKIIATCGMIKKVEQFFDGYTDDKLASVTIEKKAGVKITYLVESELTPDQTADYMKGIFSKANPALTLSIRPDGYFG